MNFHGGQYKKEGLLDFSVNIPTIPFEADYKTLLNQTIETLYEYPEIDGAKAREAISKTLDWPASQIILGNGATDLIYLITRALKFPRAMVLEPTFTEYSRALELSGTTVVHQMMTELSGLTIRTFDVSPDTIASVINQSACDALFICNPNNPTGQLFKPDMLDTMLSKVSSSNFLLVIDESFIEFKERQEHTSAMRSLMTKYNILVIRSMTKTYCVPGLRIGYAFGSEETISRINRFRDPWALNRFALESIPYFLKQEGYLSKLQKWCAEESSALHDELKRISGITAYESEANFILFKYERENPLEWHEKLILKGLYLRTCTDFHGLGPNYFRMAVKDRHSNQKCIEIIREGML